MSLPPVRSIAPVALALAVTAFAASALGAGHQAPSTAILIQHALVIDGTGAAGRRADVRISGDRITEVGQLTPAAGERIVDAGGLALAPGFIDTHSHHDRGLVAAPDAAAMVTQGVTTIVIGQDGGGIDLGAMFARLEREPASVNVAAYAGHGAIRERVMGQDFKRHATPAEIERMASILKTEMEAGALGLSTGLEYDPGIYSTPEEVLGAGESRRRRRRPVHRATSAARTGGSGRRSTK